MFRKHFIAYQKWERHNRSTDTQFNLSIIQEWKVIMEDTGQRYKYVENTEEFRSIDPAVTDKVLGLWSKIIHIFSFIR
jgi:alkaline phosphatase